MVDRKIAISPFYKMDTKEYRREYYKKRKENGICLYCKNKAIEGLTYCEDCKKKQIEYIAETRKFCKENRICPRCQKSSILGDEKTCVECRATLTNNALKRRSKNREAYNQYMKDYHRKIHNERKAQGICTRCGTRSVKNTMYFTCEVCRDKTRENINPQIKKEERVANGLCYWCGDVQKAGYKLCEKHYQMNVSKSRCEKAQIARQRQKQEDHNRYIAYHTVRKEA